jgi:hypothetical protein
LVVEGAATAEAGMAASEAAGEVIAGRNVAVEVEAGADLAGLEAVAVALIRRSFSTGSIPTKTA